MKIKEKNMNRLIIAVIIIFAAFTRIMPHPPNFTPIIAMGLFGGAYLKDKRWALLLPVGAMLLADIFLGFHGTMIWVYGSLIIITTIGFLLKRGVTLQNGVIATISGSLLFFLVTNFGVWASGSFYPKNVEGLISCYAAGIPFFGNTLGGSIFYSSLMFVGYEQVRTYFPIVVPDSIQK